MAQGVILLIVDHKANRDLLEKALKKYYDMKFLDSEDRLDQDFDLAIFDGASLNRFRKQIKAHREKKSDVFQPILLVSSRQDIGIVTGQLWQSIDEILFTPVDKVELLARVEVLLRAHNYSVELARLYQDAREQATYAERLRLARELHDSVTQMIYSASALAQTLPQMQKKDPERAKAQLEEVVQLNRSALSEMRALLFDMRPDNLIRMSLSELFDQLAVAARGRRSINITTHVDVPALLPEAIHLGLYRIVQEAFNNILKHSEATEASVHLSVNDGQLVLKIHDNGKGFDIDEQRKGLGLDGMQERTSLMNATLTITSSESKGTEIIVSQPIPQGLATDSAPKL